jgi:hypothetical protein
MALIYIPFTAFVVQAIFASCGENIWNLLTKSSQGMPRYESIPALFGEAADEMEPGAIARGAMQESAAADYSSHLHL